MQNCVQNLQKPARKTPLFEADNLNFEKGDFH